MKWFIHSEDEKNQHCWTITNTEGVPGWNTANGSLGYGLPKIVAEQIVALLNEHDLDAMYKAKADRFRWEMP
jgi:hypothetical protein